MTFEKIEKSLKIEDKSLVIQILTIRSEPEN